MGVAFATIVLAVALSVAKLVGATLLAGLATRQLFGDKTQTFVRELSRLNMGLMLPCLIYTRCSEGITSELAWDCRTVPLFMFLFMAIGFCVGHAVSRIAGPPHHTSLFVPVIAFSNIVGLALPLVSSLIDELGPTFFDDDLDLDDTHARAVSILFLANLVPSATMWAFAARMMAPDAYARGGSPSALRPPSAKQALNEPRPAPGGSMAERPTMAPSGAGGARDESIEVEMEEEGKKGRAGGKVAEPASSSSDSSRSSDESPETGQEVDGGASDGLARRPSLSSSSPPSPPPSPPVRGHAQPEENGNGHVAAEASRTGINHTAALAVADHAQASRRSRADLARAAATRVWVALAPLRERPAAASILGLFTDITGPARRLWVDDDAPLRLIMDAMGMLGDAAVPLVIVILGSNLLGSARAAAAPPLVSRRALALAVLGKVARRRCFRDGGGTSPHVCRRAAAALVVFLSRPAGGRRSGALRLPRPRRARRRRLRPDPRPHAAPHHPDHRHLADGDEYLDDCRARGALAGGYVGRRHRVALPH